MLDRLPPHGMSQSPRSHSRQEERIDDDTIRINRTSAATPSMPRSEPTPEPVRRLSHSPPAVRLPSSTTGSLSSVPLSPPRENPQVQQVINEWLGTEPVSALLRQTADASRSPSLHPVGTSRQTSSHSLTSTGSESSSEGVIQIPTQAPAPIRLPDQESMRRLAEELGRNVSEESVRTRNTTPIGFSPLRSEELPRNATPGPSQTRVVEEFNVEESQPAPGVRDHIIQADQHQEGAEMGVYGEYNPETRGWCTLPLEFLGQSMRSSSEEELPLRTPQPVSSPYRPDTPDTPRNDPTFSSSRIPRVATPYIEPIPEEENEADDEEEGYDSHHSHTYATQVETQSAYIEEEQDVDAPLLRQSFSQRMSESTPQVRRSSNITTRRGSSNFRPPIQSTSFTRVDDHLLVDRTLPEIPVPTSGNAPTVQAGPSSFQEARASCSGPSRSNRRQSMIDPPPHLEQVANSGAAIGELFRNPRMSRSSEQRFNQALNADRIRYTSASGPSGNQERHPERSMGEQPPGPPEEPPSPTSERSPTPPRRQGPIRYHRPPTPPNRPPNPPGPPGPPGPPSSPSQASNRQNREPRPWQGPRPLHIDPKVKIDNLPKWDGDEDQAITWLLKVQMLAEQGYWMFMQLGRFVPLQFEGLVNEWWISIPWEDRETFMENWGTLKNVIMNQFMHTRWFNDQVYKTQRMRFRDSKHEDEKPLAYVIRKKLHMQLLQPQTFDILIYEIMAGAPTAWAQILRVEELDGQWTTFVSRVQQYEDLLIEAKYQEKSGQIMRRLERLEKNSHNRHSHARVAHPKPHKSKGKGKARARNANALIGQRNDQPVPCYAPQKPKFEKVKRRPSQVGARMCTHCNGDHWDNECPKSRKNQRQVRDNLAATDADGLAAQEAYDELYENLSSNESSDSSEDSFSDSETEKPSESTSSSSELGFESPSNVLSAATSSDTPITESEVLSDVLEGNSEGQAQVGIALAKSFNIRTSSQHLANQIIPKLPSRRQLTKHYKLAKKRAYLGHTTIGSKVVLRRISSRPPGTHWMGTKSSVISGWIGPVTGDPTKIIFDSGSEITLISEKLYKSLNPKPSVHIGQGVRIIQVKGNTETKNYITVPLTFETPQGQVEMLVDAYIVPDMTTGFLLGNDFSNQYQLSLIRESNHSYVKAGSSNRQIPVIGTSTDPRTDSAGSFRVETIPLDTRPKRHKKSLKKALKQAPPGTVPVRIYKTITIAPESLMLVKVKATFDMGQSEGYVERLMSSNCSEEDLFGITDCIISANNPKLQIANFSKFPVKLQAGRIIGYMSTSMNILWKEEELTEGQLHEFHSRTMWIKSVQKKEKIQPEPFDTSWSKQVKGGPKTAELPELEQTPSTKLLDEVDINPKLNKEQKAQIEKIVLQNAEAFGLDGRLGNYPAHVPIKLQDEDAPPIALTPYTHSPAKKEAIDKQIDDWLRLEVITESDSPWAFPVIVVYCNDKPRVCIDYRKLNERAIPDQFPLPKQTDILHALEGAQFLSTLDALAGFTQLTIKEEDRLKTAFRCHRGLFQFNQLPFGFLNGPSAFQRVMQKVLAPFLWLFALVYIEDIVIYSKTFEEHLLHLDTIFKSIIKAGITLSPKKCHLGYQSLLLLGHKVSRLGLSTHKEKVEHILNLAPPKNVKELRTFAGLIGYFGNSIPFGAWILAVLFQLLRKSEKWVWGPLQQRAFELAKEALASAPVLAYPVVGMPYRLYTDASEVGLSGILQQVQYIEVQDLEGTNALDTP
ncbi:Retrovirus-related Pol polyprotein from transposon [Ceratobasidium sp. AG-Ba]|nr:Retrovirus-related Pol polyprotein from transposon [Ceratobasidium sp. AG-Ba]